MTPTSNPSDAGDPGPCSAGGSPLENHVAGCASCAPGERSLPLEVLAPFRLDLTAWALRRRAHNAVDRWDGLRYSRAVLLDDRPVAVSVQQEGSAGAPGLTATLIGAPVGRSAEALARCMLEKLLGLTLDISGFATMAAQDPLLRGLAARMRGFRPPRFASVFEALVNAVACQQLSITVGIHLLNRLTAEYGRAVAEAPDGPRVFPGPRELARLAPDDLRRLGFSLSKARTIIGAAQAILDGDLDLESLEHLDDQATIDRLSALYGVGRWSAEYVMLRGLGRLHVFPGDDVGARNKLERFLDIESSLDYEGVARVLARWRPYAGIIYLHLLLDSLSEARLVDA